MTILAVVSVAAICAGLVWWERRVVSRQALQRCAARRERRPWDNWDDLLPPSDELTGRLAGAIESAVFAGDFAFAYRDRLDPGLRRGESPFQFRRSRVEASVRRYERAVAVVTEAAHGWLGDDTAPDQRRSAVQRMLGYLEEEGARASSVGNMAAIETTIDVLENALANLRRPPSACGVVHPFR